MAWDRHLMKKMQAKREIFVGIPTMSSRVTVAIVQFLITLERFSLHADFPWRFSWQIVNGRRPVEYARNWLVGICLKKTKAERLWFVDEDMLPTAESMELLDVDADVVAGRAWAFDHAGENRDPGLKLCLFNYNLKGDYKFNPIIPQAGDDVIDCVGMGTATMLIKRALLEDPRMRVGDAYTGLDEQPHAVSEESDKEEWAPPVFRTIYKPNGHILRGEDLDFCLRAHTLGYSVKAHVGAAFGHLKEVNLDDVARLCELTARRVAAKYERDAAPQPVPVESAKGESNAKTDQVA